MKASNTGANRVFSFTVALILSSGAIRAEQSDNTEAKPVPERNQITGDWLGTRPLLSDKGIEIFGGYTVEVWGNTTGGLKTGSVYTGLLDFCAEVDLEKAIGWQGASVSTTWLWLSGRNASEDLAGNFLTISPIAGFNTLRMFELWFQQNLLDDKTTTRLASDLTAHSSAMGHGTRSGKREPHPSARRRSSSSPIRPRSLPGSSCSPTSNTSSTPEALATSITRSSSEAAPRSPFNPPQP